MLEIRIHGRGGQGAVVASKVLAAAFFKEGHYVQAFPVFGVERRGAPVAAFVRVDQNPVRLRCNVYEPHHLIVLDPALTETIDITEGLRESGWILLNTHRTPEEFGFARNFKVASVDAFAIAIRHHLGSRSTPIVNTAILGAFARCTGLVNLDSVVNATVEAVPFNAEGNRQAAIDAYEQTIMYDPELQTR
ncbi:MAG: 2-oxoacid:acceptor oxidoreductase family protein [Candidatus Latescibacterota bacterium]|nr:MAG: 2-oxoacid:acceptor oxidoreductase family protein [Candidatus Latescibacterota bacterium]